MMYDWLLKQGMDFTTPVITLEQYIKGNKPKGFILELKKHYGWRKGRLEIHEITDDYFLVGILSSVLVKLYIERNTDKWNLKSPELNSIAIVNQDDPINNKGRLLVTRLTKYSVYFWELTKDAPHQGSYEATMCREISIGMYFRSLADAVLLEMYFGEAIRSYDRDFIKHLDIEAGLNHEQLLDLHKELYDVDNSVVRANHYFLSCVPIINKLYRGR